MQEYYGANVKNYHQPPDKFVRLFPAIERILEKLTTSAQSVLDIGCGDGVLYPMFEAKNYIYTGVDISEDMILQAREKNPAGNFIIGAAHELPKELSETFDIVISNMLLPAIGDRNIFSKIFKESARVMHQGSYFIVATTNPYFDGYMQKMLFDRLDIETEFKGYYESTSKYLIHKETAGVKFTFEDYHWTFSDYMEAGKEADLQFETIDECKPITDAVERGGPAMEKMLRFPNFIVLVFTKVH